MENKNIILVNPTLVHGGTQRVTSILCNQWANEGHNVTLVLVCGGERFFTINPKVRVIDLNFKYKNIFNKLINEIKIIFKLYSIFRRFDPEFILSFVTQFNIVSIVAAKLSRKRIFVSERSNPKLKLPSLQLFLRNFLYKYANGVISQSSLAKSIFESECKSNNICVIPNPVKDVALYPLIKREKIIISVGRLVEGKGYKYLLDIFSKINNLDWQLVVLGDGPLKDELVARSINLDINDRVHFLGAVNDVDMWLAKSSIFSFTSLSEGFPNALTEAMASGLPVVSFDCDAGPRDIIEDGINGYLVPIFDSNQFHKYLSQLIENKELRKIVGMNALRIRNDLNKDIIAKKYFDFCRDTN
jgi:GalNAc-alpha-(1->4)-GalNAc-alpha-(1->3)-diNAcBac-PP-undecaprenol alpha-1,4-N-acetyl-D-galactosaminyltransferase